MKDIKKIYNESLICDLTLPWVPEAENKKQILERYYNNKFNFVSLSVGVERMNTEQTIKYIKKVKSDIQKNKNYIYSDSVKSIKHAKKRNKLSLSFHFQGSEMLGGKVTNVKLFYDLGIRHMLLAKDYRSKAADGCFEPSNAGLSLYGRSLIKEMNRVGMVVDMSHSAEKSTFDAIEISEKPIAITHANPSFWHDAKRNKSNKLLKILSQSGGMIGLSLYPHHLKDGTNCTLNSFCEMVAKTADIIDVKNIGIGSDLCLYQPDKVVEWMRNGTWTKSTNFGEGSKKIPGFPKQPEWFLDARGFKHLEIGLKKVGFNEVEINGVLGNNWYKFYKGIN